MHLFSQSLSIVLRCGGSAAECHLQHLERQVYSVARFCPYPTSMSLCYRRRVAALCKLYKVNSSWNHCLFSEIPSTSVRVRHIRAAAPAHPLEFEVSRCITSQFARCFVQAQTRMWNDLPYTVFDTRTLYGFKGAVECGMTFPTLCLTPEHYMGLKEQSIGGCFPEFIFQFFVTQVPVELRKQFIVILFFPFGLRCW